MINLVDVAMFGIVEIYNMFKTITCIVYEDDILLFISFITTFFTKKSITSLKNSFSLNL